MWKGMESESQPWFNQEKCHSSEKRKMLVNKSLANKSKTQKKLARDAKQICTFSVDAAAAQ